LLDRAVLRNLIESYASFCDAGEPDRIAGLFTEDADLIVALNPGADPTAVRHGRAEIAGAMSSLSRYWSTMHIIANVNQEIDGDTARGLIGCVAHHIEGPEGERRDRVLNIRYVDEYAKTEGTWRFKRREVRVVAVEKRPLTIE
jgi:ketosteroid isomerase-like protein